jgi:hypothetical protein
VISSMPGSKLRSITGMLPTPDRTPHQDDGGSPSPGSDVRDLFKRVCNLQTAVIEEQARRSKMDQDIRNSLQTILAKVEQLLPTMEINTSADDVDSVISALSEIPFAGAEDDATEPLLQDGRVCTLDRSGRLRDDRGLFLKRRKPVQHPSSIAEESQTSVSSLQYTHGGPSASCCASRSSSEDCAEDDRQDATIEERGEDQTVQYHFIELDPPDAPARSTRAATERETAKEPCRGPKDPIQSTAVPAAKKGGKCKDKKVLKQEKAATVVYQKDRSIKAAKPYSKEELHLIGSSIQHLLSTTDMPRRKVFEKVSADIKSQGYYRTVGTLQVRWYTQLHAMYPIPRHPQKTVVERPTGVENPPTAHQPSPQASADAGAPEGLPHRELPNRPSKLDLLQERQTVAKGCHSIFKTSLDEKLLKIRLGDSTSSTRSTQKLVPEFLRSSSRFFVATSTWT